MSEETKSKLKKALEEMRNNTIIEFKDYMEFLNWKGELKLKDEFIGYDTVIGGVSYQYNKVFFEGEYNDIEAICKIELPF